MIRALFPILSLLTAYPAAACLPPPPGTPEPPRLTPAERARDIHAWATDIAYGVVTRSDWNDNRYGFRILHAYKGDLRPGQVIAVDGSFGFDPPLCMATPPPVDRGAYGVIAFRNDMPALNFVDDAYLQAMFDADLIRRASTSPRTNRHSAPSPLP